MSTNHSIAGLALPRLEPDHRLQRVLSSALKGRSISVLARSTAEPSHFWKAEFFNLDKVKLFQEASIQEQTAILDLVNQDLWKEAYSIEKAGMGYMAKMVLLAETTEERMLYGLFTADETEHLSQIQPFLPPSEPIATENPFLQLVSELVESSDKSVLLFVIQVVLEGWGLSHYRRLAKGCDDRSLRALFTHFLEAEARHHGTGLTLFNQTTLSATSRAAIIEVLVRFLQMVQVGPQGVLAAIDQVKGPCTRSQKIQILEALETETHSGSRLQLLRSLMRGEAASPIVQTLAEQGAFEPLPAHQCV